MGLGILFVGYFLLLNFAYSYFTDAIAAAVMLYAFYKLSGINRGFRRGAFAAGGFLLLGLAELLLSVLDTVFVLGDISAIYTALAILRHLTVFILTMLMLLGISELSDEVDLPELSKRCKRNIYFSMGVYLLNILLETTELADLIDPKILVSLYLISLILTLVIISLNLIAVYGAYMRIYIPETENKQRKKSKLRSAFEAHEEEKAKEYAEYRLEKLKNKKKRK